MTKIVIFIVCVLLVVGLVPAALIIGASLLRDNRDNPYDDDEWLA